ncbi:MAG: DUF485 domain-containing protein [Bdellovibrionales bacterium]
MTDKSLNWHSLASDPRFKELQRRKSGYLKRLFVFGIAYYFMLPVGAAWLTDIFRVQLWGPINIGLIFALSQFAVAWGIAWCYAKKAGTFDASAEAIARDVQKGRA